MANPEHLEILKQGVEVWNRWRAENPNIRPRLSRANLAGLNLSGVDLSGSSLREANLRGANLKKATFSNTNLTGTDLNEADFKGANLILARLLSANCQHANFSNADLNLADFGGANLSGANFSHADLSGANFNVTDLSGANFRNTLMGYTMFCRVDLREVEGLETAYIWGRQPLGLTPSTTHTAKFPKLFSRVQAFRLISSTTLIKSKRLNAPIPWNNWSCGSNQIRRCC